MRDVNRIRESVMMDDTMDIGGIRGGRIIEMEPWSRDLGTEDKVIMEL